MKQKEREREDVGYFLSLKKSMKCGKTLLQLKPLEQKFPRLTKMVFKEFFIEENEEKMNKYNNSLMKSVMLHKTYEL